MTAPLIDDILNFLACETPELWLQAAVKQQDILLLDHAHCEKKAALSAIHLLHRYPRYHKLVFHASRLAREELRHFEQVLTLLHQRDIEFTNLMPSNYAAGLREDMATQEPQRFIDLLIISAFIEARSCERFHRLVPYLDAELSQFYHRLFTAEARHFSIYLNLAQRYAQDNITERIAFFADRERQLIQAYDQYFRFHSGIPA